MKKHRLVILTAILLAFGLGFLTCFILVKSDGDKWEEREDKIQAQIDKLNRMIEGMNEDHEEMVEYNERAVIKPGEEGK